jgi:hypothetical protein
LAFRINRDDREALERQQIGISRATPLPEPVGPNRGSPDDLFKIVRQAA